MVEVSTSGGSGLVFLLWANDDHQLISDMPGNTVISRGLLESLTIVAAEDLINRRWFMDGHALPAPEGVAQSVAIRAVNYVPGRYSLVLYAEREREGVLVPYSTEITFTVDD
jgi:hypothetical protein